MAGFSLVPSSSVPVVPQLVNDRAKALLTHSNPQTPIPPFPVLFYDQVTVPSGGANDFRSDAFTNNLNRAVEIHGMRIMIQLQAVQGGALPNPQIRGGGVVALEMEIDGVTVTRGSVPVWHLCRSDNRRNDTYLLNAHTDYCWYFSQPAPLLPGRNVKLRAIHLGGNPFQALVSVSLAGRVSPAPIPKRIPFAAAWTSRAFNLDEYASDSCPPNALANDTGTDLVIDRIIGRSIAFDAVTGFPATEELADFDDIPVRGVNSLHVRMGVSMSRPILKTYTMWRAVFGQNASLETDFVMRPGDFLTADVHYREGPFLPGGNTFQFTQTRGSLSILGWREV